VGPRPKPQKSPILNSPIKFLFAKQREILKFLQNKKRHLVTLFLVSLRVFPFSELDPKKFQTQNQFNSGQTTLISAISHRPIIKGRRADLIFFVTRYL
jgi:hypothetical protein